MRRTGVFLFFVLFILSFSAHAAPAPVPSSATPSAVVRELQQPTNTLPTKKLTKKLPEPSLLQTKQVPVSASTPGAFILQSVQLIGSSIAPPPAALKLIANYKGKSVDLQSLQMLARELENTYREAGWVLNQVVLPPQTIDPKIGEIHFQVIDGHISQIELTGSSAAGARTQLQRYLDQISAMKPFNFKRAERYLLLANDIPGLQLKGTLRADPSQSGASILVVSVERQWFQGLVNINNRSTQYIGPNQVLVQGQVNDLVAADDLQLAFATIAPNSHEMAYFNANYTLQLGQRGTQWNAALTDTTTYPGGSFAPLGLKGELQQYQIGVSQPVLRSLAQNIWLLANAYHTDNQSNYSTGPAFHDRITGVQAGVNYQGLALGGGNNIQLMATQGIPLNGVTATYPSRTGAVQNFSKFTALASHVHYLTQKTSVVLAGNGQMSAQSLPVSEQIGYGGSLFGLAYQPSDITGDQGLMGSAALRYDLPTFWHFQLLQPFVAYDIGQVWVHQATAGQSSSPSGASFALGVNLGLKAGLQGSLTAAKPLTLAPTNNANKGWEGFFNLSWVF